MFPFASDSAFTLDAVAKAGGKAKEYSDIFREAVYV
jgi:hypothetical protein